MTSHFKVEDVEIIQDYQTNLVLFSMTFSFQIYPVKVR